MRKSSGVLTAVLLAGILLYPAMRAGAQETDHWEGTIKKVGAVIHVFNPEYPWKGTIELEGEDVWKISGPDIGTAFTRAVSIAVDSHDNVYVFDKQYFLIYKFDSRAKLLLKIPIRKISLDSTLGNMNMVVDSHDNIWISRTNGTFFKLSPEGKELLSRTFSSTPSEFGITKDDKLILKGPYSSPDGFVTGVIKLNSVTGKAAFIAPIQEEKKKAEKVPVKSGKMLMVLYHDYQPKGIFHSGVTVPGVFGFSKDYQITVLDPSGEIAFVIEKEEPAQSITPEEKEKIYEMYEKSVSQQGLTKANVHEMLNLPDAKPYYSGFLTDDRGDIYVIRSLEQRINAPVDVDVFDKEGCYTLRTRFPVLPVVIRNGFFYFLEYDRTTKTSSIRKRSIVNWKELVGEDTVSETVSKGN